MNGWNVAFIVLQFVMTISLGWFIRLLVIFSKEIKAIEHRVDKVEKSHAVCKAVRKEKEFNIMESLRRIETTLTSITSIQIK